MLRGIISGVRAPIGTGELPEVTASNQEEVRTADQNGRECGFGEWLRIPGVVLRRGGPRWKEIRKRFR